MPDSAFKQGCSRKVRNNTKGTQVIAIGTINRIWRLENISKFWGYFCGGNI